MRTPLLLSLTLASVLAKAQPTICDELEAGFFWVTTPNGTQFSNGTTGTGFQTSCYWTFGDGTNSYDAQPLHAYSEPGVYEVCLVAVSIFETGGGVLTCMDTTCAEVVIEGSDPCDGLSAEFWTDSNGGDPASIFYSAANGNGPYWLWSFGDGTYSDDGPQGTHTYTAPGTYTMCLTVWDWIPGTQDTCSVTTCQNIVIEAGGPCDDLIACFEANPIDNDSFIFENCTQPNTNIQYVWHFGDGTTSSEVNPDHTYLEPGVYTVCLTAYWNDCVDEFCTTVTVAGGDVCDELVAGFSWFTMPTGTQFSNASAGTGFQTSWTWTFGDGGSSNDAQPFHTYAAPGVYLVCLVAVSTYETSSGVVTCTDEYCYEVVIQGGGNVCDELDVAFTATTTPNGTQFTSTIVGAGFQTVWTWYFGDGTTGDGPQPFHTYAEPGVYAVCVVVVSSYETSGGVVTCTAEWCEGVEVGEGGPCDDLVACFEVDAVDNDSFIFQNCTQPSTNVQYVWHFGDGTTEGGVNPDHTYSEPGVYTVCLTAYWNDCVDEFCTTVTVAGDDVCDELVAGFSWFTMPTGTQFSNASSGTGFQTIWTWHFGDGTTSNDAQPFHSYAEPGVYVVCLVAVSSYETSAGLVTCTDEFCEEVTVGEGGCAPFEVDFVWTGQGPAVVFNADASTSVNGYLWFFGDGTEGWGQTVTHLYEPPGPFNVCVAAWYWNSNTQDTCWAEHCEEVDPFDVGMGETLDQSLGLFPIPANDQLFITGLHSPADLALFTADGRVVLSARSVGDRYQMDVSGLAPGAYTMMVSIGDERSVRKVILE